MKVIGLTGGISSGKSTVSAMLRELGGYIIDIDALARRVVEPGQPAWEKIRDFFGPVVFCGDGTINRQVLGDIVFRDEAARNMLESITHPPIAALAADEVRKAAQEGFAVAVLDAPLLIEAGWHTAVDAVWLVYVDADRQLARLVKRDGLTIEQALARIGAQMSLEDKLVYADVAIHNGGSQDDTRRQVEEAWRDLLQTVEEACFTP